MHGVQNNGLNQMGSKCICCFLSTLKFSSIVGLPPPPKNMWIFGAWSILTHRLFVLLFLDCFEGYSAKKQNPMYMTSAMEYGWVNAVIIIEGIPKRAVYVY